MNFKDTKVLAAIGIVVLLLIFGGLFFLTSKKPAAVSNSDDTQSEVIPTLSKDDIGLSMDLTPDNKKVRVNIAKASDIKRVEGDITYDADSDQDKTIKVPQDISFDEPVTGSSFQTDYFDLATCSKNVCRYHTGFDKVQVMLKITKKDGKVYQASDTVPTH